MAKEYQRAWYLRNKEKILARQKEYYENNKTERLDYADSYYRENKNSVLESQKERQRKNRSDITKYHIEYDKERCKSDPIYRLRKNVSMVVYSALKSQNSPKRGKSVMSHIPYTIQELKEHLEKQFEPWMNWNNHGIHNSKIYDASDSSTWTWNIDHIIPQSKLPYTSMEDDNFKKCWALSNLRPLLSKLNLEKGNR